MCCNSCYWSLVCMLSLRIFITFRQSYRLGSLCPNGIVEWSKEQYCDYHAEWNDINNTHTHTHNHLTFFGPGLPGWASTRRNTHPLTPILVIGHPLSTYSIYYDPWHPLCSVYELDCPLWQPLFRSSLVFLLVLDPVLHTPCISSPSHHLLFASHAHTNAVKWYKQTVWKCHFCSSDRRCRNRWQYCS